NWLYSTDTRTPVSLLYLQPRPPPRPPLFPYTTLFRSFRNAPSDANNHNSKTGTAVGYKGIRSVLTQPLKKLSDLRLGVRCETARSEEHTSELQSRENLVCRLLLEKKINSIDHTTGIKV